MAKNKTKNATNTCYGVLGDVGNSFIDALPL